MRFATLLLLTLLSSWLLPGCTSSQSGQPTSGQSNKPTSIRYDGKTYQLLRYGKPYFIEGAGGIMYYDRLKAAGGNSIRIWDDIDAGQLLDEAHRLGLTVMFGLWVEREIEGFDYDDQAAVDRQYERIRKTVLKYRNHPALLLWCVGNEWAQNADNFKVYDEVNRLAKLVHDLDPDHPVSTAISPDSKRAIWLVAQRCPAVDVLSVNAYALTSQLSEFFSEGGWKGPYIISEYGAQAYWETTTTPWSAPIEPSSDQKADFVRRFYPAYIGSRPANCLGAYLFYWGTKQEESHTWFSVFDDKGRETPLVGLMQELWSGRPPANQAPSIRGLLIDGQPTTHQSFAIRSGKTGSRKTGDGLHRGQVMATDAEGDSLTYLWEIKPRALRTADYIGTPRPALEGLFVTSNQSAVSFRLPTQPGAYRLFVNVYDTHNHVATGNFSFEITGKPASVDQ